MRDTYTNSIIKVYTRKVRVNIGHSKVMRCSRYDNERRMQVILNAEPLEEVDCFKYHGVAMAAAEGFVRDLVHRMNDGRRAWGALKSALVSRGLGIL